MSIIQTLVKPFELISIRLMFESPCLQNKENQFEIVYFQMRCHSWNNFFKLIQRDTELLPCRDTTVRPHSRMIPNLSYL